MEWLFFTTSLGMSLVLSPLVLTFFDPVLAFIKYYFRFGNGTVLHHLMLEKIEGPRLYFTVFNYTNAKEFIAGEHAKIKIQEVGPFVFQEYRINEEMEIEEESNLIKYTPRVWIEFIPEESIGDPKDIFITCPNLTVMQGSNLISQYPFLIRNIFNILIASIGAKAIVNMTVSEYFWSRHDPLIEIGNKAVPGLFYYNSSGILDRMFEPGVKFTTYIASNEEEKFSVKKVVKWRNFQDTSKPIIDSVSYFNNSYEGAVFPPNLTPDMPIAVFRHGICKSLRLAYTGTKITEYGSKAFTFDFANDTLNKRELCFEKGKWCPTGLINLTPCFLQFPIVASRGHLLDVDPRLQERFEGFKPDRKLHSTQMVVDPQIGVSYTSNASIQANLFLGEIGFNPQTRPFKNSIMPIVLVKINHPHLPPVATAAFLLLYKIKPYIVYISAAVNILLGFGLLTYSMKLWYRSKYSKTTTEIILRENIMEAYFPLM